MAEGMHANVDPLWLADNTVVEGRPGIHAALSESDTLVTPADSLAALGVMVPYSFPEGIGHAHDVGYANSFQRAAHHEKQLEFIAEHFEITNPIERCIRASDIQAIHEGDTAFAITDFSFEQLSILKAAKDLQSAGDYGAELYDVMTYPDHGIMVCDFVDGGNWGAWNNWNDIKIIQLDITAINRDTVQSPMSVFLEYPYQDIEGLSPAVTLTLMEEAGHGVENIVYDADVNDTVATYSAKDQMLWYVSREARTKLSNVIAAIDMAITHEDGSLVHTILEQGDGEMDMLVFLADKMQQTEDISPLSDPDVLFEAFTQFFKNEWSMSSYFFPDNYEWNDSVERLPIDEYVSKFGQILLSDNIPNFLEGRFETMDNVAELIPLDYDMRFWLDANTPVAEETADQPLTGFSLLGNFAADMCP